MKYVLLFGGVNLRWRETEVRDIMLNPASIGIKVRPEETFLLTVRGYYLLLASKYSEEELTKERFVELYIKFLHLAKEYGFTIESYHPNFTDGWINNQLRGINGKRNFAVAIAEMLHDNR